MSEARDAPHGPGYAEFLRAVVAAQLAAWLPDERCRILDLSGTDVEIAGQAADLGHDVVRLLRDGERALPVRRGAAGTLAGVVADPTDLGWCAADSVDVVLAEGGAMSTCLATEVTVAHIARILRPGGRALICVDSLLRGCAALAEAGRWAELSDVPAADVVLVPRADGSLRRCFSPEDLRGLLTDAGLVVEWVRPRTVLPAGQVEATVAADPSRLPALVRTEVALATQRQDESVGTMLVAAASRPLDWAASRPQS